MRTMMVALLVLGIAGTPARGQDDDLPDKLRSFFEEIAIGAQPLIAGQELAFPRELSEFYGERNHQPMWTAGGPLADQAAALLAAVRASEGHGLYPRSYHAPVLAQMIEGPVRPLDLALELLASDAFLRQARDRTRGAVSPRTLDPDWHLVPPDSELTDPLRHALDPGASVAGILDALWPRHREYRALVAKRAELAARHEEPFDPIPDGPLLRPGASNERVELVKRRVLGPGAHDTTFDPELKQAVMALQREAGIEADGIVGPATLEVLNATPASRIERIDANLERWRWLPPTVPETYIRVNIAAFSLRVIQRGHDVLNMSAIVGRPYRRTPTFSESIRYLVFNPYWNVPFKLATLDKLPLLQKDPAALVAQGYEVRPEGEDAFRPVDTVDWSGVSRRNFHYLLRQRPGPFNALGRVKFMLPNPHDVYLHDTPDRELFARQERGFSSGCIRVSEALELARWVLANDGRDADAGRVAELAEGGETTTIYLKQPLPVYLVYFTAFTDDSGTVVFRRDLYQRDGAIVAALREAHS